MASPTELVPGQKLRVKPPNGWVRNEAAREAERQAAERADQTAASERRARQATSEDERAVSGGSLGFIASALGAVATGAASGKNAARLQAIGTALQGQAPSSPQTATADVSRTVPSVNQCIQVSRPNSAQVRFTNTCNITVHVRYCFEDVSRVNPIFDARDAACSNKAGNNAGTVPIPPGGSDGQNAPTSETRVHFIACPSGQLPPGGTASWDGHNFNGTCNAVRKLSGEAGNSVRMGAVQ